MSVEPSEGRIGEGRARPAFEPRSLQCPNCGSPLTAQDERAMLIVCPACSSEVQLTAGEAVVLGERSGEEPAFKLQLGQSFHWEGHRWEVAARLAYSASDDDWDDPPTHMYLLYSPRRRSMWLSDYDGSWDLSWTSHVAPTTLPFNESRVQTFDGRTFTVDETDLATLIWVDGAVPWVARKGDQWIYAECSDGQGNTYEVERSAEQLEFAEGRKLLASEVYEALGMEQEAAQAAREERRRRPVSMLTRGLLVATALLAVFVNAVVCLGATGSGNLVYENTWTPADFALAEGEILTEPIRIEEGLVQVSLEAQRLSNAWVAVDLALVKEDKDTVIHVDGLDAEYYSGVEGGESWSEGSRSADATWIVPETNVYHLLVRARGNTGNLEQPEPVPPTSVRIEVRDGVMAWWWPAIGFLLSILAAVVSVFLVIQAPRSMR